MGKAYSTPGISDSGGRRSGMDRRRFFTPRFSSWRRSDKERRDNQDRRIRNDQRNVSYLRRQMDRYLEVTNTHKGLAYGLLLSLPFWALIILYIMGKLSF